MPKQLMDFWGEPLIRRTVRNLSGVVPPAQQWVITSAELAPAVAALVPELTPRQIIGEPIGRNTAPCVGLAASILDEIHGDCVFGLFPSDHSIRDIEAWEQCLRLASDAAMDDCIVTLGIRPTRPETGYGYIELDEASEGTVLAVRRFVEKPPRELAQSYLASGRFLWNAGIFFCRTRTMLAEIQRQMPELHAGLQELRLAWREGRFEQAMQEIYPTLPSKSIDFGVMENARCVRVVPASFGWTDLGHWAALEDDLPCDAHGNVALGSTLLLDCENSVVVDTLRSGRKLVALGVRDLVIVDTEDALLVCARERVQDVRQVVDALAAEGRDDLL